MRIVISIFTLPHEIDDLETLLTQLRRASKHLSGKHEWVLDVSMCIANDMVDWKRSALPKSYFIDKLLIKLLPNIFALGRSVVIQKIK